jgi:glycosyltransferase involved in cell wall biosynthesis
MRIAFLSPAWPYGQNGIITYVRNISQALHGLGHEVFVLTVQPDGQLGFEQVVRVGRAGRPPLLDRLWSKASRVLRGSGKDWQAPATAIADALSGLAQRAGIEVFEMEETFGWAGVVADQVAVPVVVRLHGPYFLNGPYEIEAGTQLDPARLQREGLGISRAVAISSPSRQVLEATRHYYGLKRDAVVIPNPMAPGDAQASWSLQQCEPDTILFVGRTDVRKGGDLVLRMFAQLARQRPQLRLHFVGPDRGFVDGRPGATMQEYLLEQFGSDVRDRVVHHGALPPDQIAPLRLRCRVTVMFSRYENYPLAGVEALACGSPLVATNVGGIPEIVIDGQTGLLADPGSIDDLSAKVACLLDDAALSARLGAAGRAMSLGELSPRNVAQRTVEFYEQAVKRGR